MVTLAALIVSSISCTRSIPVRLELPNKPSYFTDVSTGIVVVKNSRGKVINFIVDLDTMSKIVKNKALCREDNYVLRAIIKSTH